jgi:hypothetical protein
MAEQYQRFSQLFAGKAKLVTLSVIVSTLLAVFCL